MLHLLYSRVENFCGRCCFKIIDFFAKLNSSYYLIYYFKIYTLSNGAPISVRSSRASSSVLAVVTIAISIPRILSILS